MKQKFPYSRFH